MDEACQEKLSKQGQSRSSTLTPLPSPETAGCRAASSSVGAACRDVKQQEAGEERRPRRSEGSGARLSRKVREQRTRFYIVRRCIQMLVCWSERDDTHH